MEDHHGRVGICEGPAPEEEEGDGEIEGGAGPAEQVGGGPVIQERADQGEMGRLEDRLRRAAGLPSALIARTTRPARQQ